MAVVAHQDPGVSSRFLRVPDRLKTVSGRPSSSAPPSCSWKAGCRTHLEQPCQRLVWSPSFRSFRVQNKRAPERAAHARFAHVPVSQGRAAGTMQPAPSHLRAHLFTCTRAQGVGYPCRHTQCRRVNDIDSRAPCSDTRERAYNVVLEYPGPTAR